MTLPEYERHSLRMLERSSLADGFALQVITTAGPHLHRPLSDCDVLDLGCGYGHLVRSLAPHCSTIVGLEPNADLAAHAQDLIEQGSFQNASVRRGRACDIREREAFDLVILDNVLEHIEEQEDAIWRIRRSLRPGGIAFIVVPNKLWPIEVHYRLPFLSYLPLAMANRYLRWSGRGLDYRDASYAPTLRGLMRLFEPYADFEANLVVPDVTLAEGGATLPYRLGSSALQRFPRLWTVSKALVVVAKKPAPQPAS